MTKYVVWKMEARASAPTLKPIACSDDPGSALLLTVTESAQTYCRVVELGSREGPRFFGNAVDGRLVEQDIRDTAMRLAR